MEIFGILEDLHLAVPEAFEPLASLHWHSSGKWGPAGFTRRSL